jgi:hypothetical protein
MEVFSLITVKTTLYHDIAYEVEMDKFMILIAHPRILIQTRHYKPANFMPTCCSAAKDAQSGHILIPYAGPKEEEMRGAGACLFLKSIGNNLLSAQQLRQEQASTTSTLLVS